MSTSRPTVLLVAGLSVTVLTFGLPLAHLGLRLQGSGMVLALLPVVVLAACWLWPARPSTPDAASPDVSAESADPSAASLDLSSARAAPSLTHLVFPVSHLPLLLAQPELVSREVYGGASGLLGLVAIASAFSVFLIAATPSLPAPRARLPLFSHPDLWRGLALAVALGPLLALALPALTALEADPLGAAVAISSGVAVSVLAAGFWMPRLVLSIGAGSPSRSGAQTDPRLEALARESRPSVARTAWVLVITALALGGLAAWTYWRP